MRETTIKLLTFFVLMLGIVTVADAQRKRTPARGKAAPVAPSPSQKTAALVPTIQSRLSALNTEIDRVAQRTTGSTETTDTASEALSVLDESLYRLSDAVAAQGSYTAELNDVLTNATRVDQFLIRNRISPSTQTQWRTLKRDFTNLISSNRMGWSWTRRVPELPADRAAVVTPVPTPMPAATPIATPAAPPFGSTTAVSTASEAQMSTLLSRIDLKTGFYRTQVENALRTNNNADVSDSTVLAYLSRLEGAQQRLRQNFDRRQTSLLDVTDLLTAATYLDQFMGRNRLTPESEGQWRDLRGDFNTLATYYQQSWNWNQALPSNAAAGTVNLRNIESRITGTYRLNRSLSDDPATILDREVGSSSGIGRQNQRAMLERRLSNPDMLALEMNDRSVSMASSILPRVTFLADGMARSETNERGRTVTTVSTLDGEGLTINYSGERASDFNLNMVPEAGGRLRVTRRIYTDESNRAITVTGVYDKINPVARWAAVAPEPPQISGTGSVPTPGDVSVSTNVENTFIFPAGTRLTAELRTPINASENVSGFTMQLTSPGQYRGSLITGRILPESPSTRVAGRTRVLLSFDTISVPGNRTYRFAGDVTAITTPNREIVDVSNQAAGTAQPQRQQQQGGAGAILGALIGAIAGVPANQSAASTVGGSILSVRGDIFYLGVGSELMIVTTTPQQ